MGIARFTTFGITLLAFPHPSHGQAVAPNDRVRVTRLGSANPNLIGTVVRATPDTLWITNGQATPTAVVLGEPMLLERSLGNRSHTLTGALVGAGVGAGITLLFLSGFCGGDTLCDGDEQLRAAAIFGIPSIVLGAGIGALIRTERWETLSSSGALSSTSVLQIGLRVAFP